jgi:glutamine amidotransferase
MGWNEIEWRNGGVGEGARLETAYFANSYICESEDESTTLAWTTHQNARFPSVVRKANTIGVQFHPEKSSSAGRAFVNALIEELVKCR